MGKLGSRLLIVLLALLVASFTSLPAMVMAQRTYTYNLSVSVEPSGGGRVMPESGTYDSGTEVTLSATPSSGYEFDYWSGDASGTDSSIRVVMDSDKLVTASFVRTGPDGRVIGIIGGAVGSGLMAFFVTRRKGTQNDTKDMVSEVSK